MALIGSYALALSQPETKSFEGVQMNTKKTPHWDIGFSNSVGLERQLRVFIRLVEGDEISRGTTVVLGRSEEWFVADVGYVQA